MAFNLPLPKVVADFDKGGAIPTAYNAINELQKLKIANKLAPLETAIKAQNALSYSNNNGTAAIFLRSISQMPAHERQRWLADPNNRAKYMSMVDQFQKGVTYGNNNSQNLLTPEMLSSLNPNEGNVFSMLGNLFSGGQNQNAMTNSPGASLPSNPINSGYDEGENEVATPEEVKKVAEEGNGSETTPKLDRNVLTAQLETNNNAINPQLKKRADNAIALDSTIQNYRSTIEQYFTNTAKYNGIYGRGKNWVDKFKKDQPDAYADYIAMKNVVVPLLANGVRFLEDMGVSHEAQKETNALIAQMDDFSIAPKTAVKVFNKTIKALKAVSDGVITAAEPNFPGVRRQLAGLKEMKGDYIPVTTDLSGNIYSGGGVYKGEQKYNPKTEVLVIQNSTGLQGKMPKDKYEKYKDEYTKVS